MSRILSHSVTTWNNCIPAFLTAIDEVHVNCFVNFLSACVLMRTWRFTVMTCVCPLINYKLATEENVHNVRVFARCNHFPITWNEFYHNTQPETISNIWTRYIFQMFLGKISAILPICIMKKKVIWKLRVHTDRIKQNSLTFPWLFTDATPKFPDITVLVGETWFYSNLWL